MRHASYSKNTRHGFTLVELAIVLVVIGLVAAGVVVGKNIIENAKLQSFIVQTELVGSAIKTFKEKYNCLPGDCAYATELFGKNTTLCNADPGTAATPGTCNGGGDSQMYQGSEKTYFWQHLILAGLLPNDTYPNNVNEWPKEKLTDTQRLNVSLYRSIGYFPNRFYITFEIYSIPQTNLISLDTTYDDGKPYSGKIQVYSVSDVYPDDPKGCVEADGDYAPASIGVMEAVGGCEFYISIE